MEAKDLYQSPPRRTSYGTAVAMVTYYGKTKSAATGTGLRLVVLRWIDTGEIDVRIVEGDGRMPAHFKVHLREAGVDPGRVYEAKQMLCDLLDAGA